MRSRRMLFLLALGLLLPGRALAAPFDFIYADQVTMRAPLASWGISLGSNSFALIVNTGPTSIGVAELQAADFDVAGVPEWPDTTTVPINPRLDANLENAHVAGPILPNEAVGGVGTQGAVLLPLVGPTETFRNLWDGSFTWFSMNGHGNSPGVVRFDLKLTIGDESVAFPIFVTLIDSPEYELTFTHAVRISSAPNTTPARSTTWGALKGLYRE